MCTTLSIVRPRADDERPHPFSAEDLFTPSPDVAGFGAARSRRLRGWVNSSAPSAIRNVPPHLAAALRGAKVCGLVPLSARRGAVAGLRARGCGSNTRGPLGDGKSHAVWECHGWSCSGWSAAAHASSTGFGTCNSWVFLGLTRVGSVCLVCDAQTDNRAERGHGEVCRPCPEPWPVKMIAVGSCVVKG
jgi:hypothetical protein